MSQIAYVPSVVAVCNAGYRHISDVRLANEFGHDTPDASSEILTVQSGAGEYTLRLCGMVEIELAGVKVSSVGKSIPPEIIAVLESSGAGIELCSGPWFEWISADGLYVSNPFDMIDSADGLYVSNPFDMIDGDASVEALAFVKALDGYDEA
jgi:hypothetical protein